MVVDSLVNIVLVCLVLPGTSADVKIWDKYGPQCTKGYFRDISGWVYIMMHIREDCIPMSLSLAARH